MLPSSLQRSYTINKLVGPLSDQFIDRVKHTDPNILIQAAQARNLFVNTTFQPPSIIPLVVPLSVPLSLNNNTPICSPILLKCDSPF